MHPLRLVQISDTHLFARPDGMLLGWPTYQSFRAVLDRAAEQRPDVVLLTGDVSQDGSAESYAAAAEGAAALGGIRGWVPGNHDDRTVMEEVLAAGGYVGEREFAAGGWRFILLDTHVPGEVHGEVADDALDDLEAVLSQEQPIPTCLVLHHNPVPVGTPWLDPLGLRAPDRLLRLVFHNPAVRLVLFGHVHQAFEAEYGSARLLSCPSTCFQFKPGSEGFALDTVSPGFRTLELYPDGTYTTQVTRVDVGLTPLASETGY